MAKSDFNFKHTLRVRYSEIDIQGVVFNAHYLTYFDVGITEYLRALGYDYNTQIERTGTDFHVVKSTIEYKIPIRYDQVIEIHVRVARIGRSSVTFNFEIYPKERDTLLSRGEVVWVNTHQSTHKSTPVPEDFRALVEAHQKTRLNGS
ncbi:MAG: acyl-CoA thioesterase [Ardenticatenaceae bacterium]